MQYILVVVKISWLITSGLNYFEILQEDIIFNISDERRTTKKLCPIRTLPCTSELNCRSKPQKLVSTGILLYGVCSTYSSTSQKISIIILFVSSSIYIIKYVSAILNNISSMWIEIELVSLICLFYCLLLCCSGFRFLPWTHLYSITSII